jgi:hypothetical protein
LPFFCLTALLPFACGGHVLRYAPLQAKSRASSDRKIAALEPVVCLWVLLVLTCRMFAPFGDSNPREREALSKRASGTFAAERAAYQALVALQEYGHFAAPQDIQLPVHFYAECGHQL